MSTQNVEFIEAAKLSVYAAFGSLIVNILIYFVGSSLDAFGDGIAINPQSGNPLGIIEISLLSIGGSVGGVLIYWFLRNRLENAKRIFLIIGASVFILMAPAPFVALEDTILLTSIFLELMHLVVAGIVFYIAYRVLD